MNSKDIKQLFEYLEVDNMNNNIVKHRLEEHGKDLIVAPYYLDEIIYETSKRILLLNEIKRDLVYLNRNEFYKLAGGNIGMLQIISSLEFNCLPLTSIKIFLEEFHKDYKNFSSDELLYCIAEFILVTEVEKNLSLIEEFNEEFKLKREKNNFSFTYSWIKDKYH